MPNNVPERTLGFVLHDVARALRKRLEQRARVLFLTPAARPLLDRIWALAAVVREEAMAGLSEPERERLIELLLKINSNLAEPSGTTDATPKQARHG